MSTPLSKTGSPVPSTASGQLPTPARRGLLPSLAVTSLVLFATYAGLTAVLLPNQVAGIDEANKIANFAAVSTVSFIFTLFAQPIFGTFSDRTRSRLGRRAPWILIGAAGGAILLMGLGSLESILWITVFWVIIQVSLNALQGPLSAIVPDRFPRERRGVASAMVGVGTMTGSTVGVLVAGNLANNAGMGYSVFGIAILVTALLFVLFNRDAPSTGIERPPFSWKQFFAGFWISPRKNPDFAWAFAARFFFILGYFLVFTFQLYILTDFIGLSLADANGAIGVLSLAGLGSTLLAVTLGGWWSDKIGRRKVFVYAAAAFMVVGLSFPIFMPNMTGMIIMGVINGVGFGLYMACDTALMTEVLPGGGKAAGKDLGILNIANNIPQALSPIVAGLLITSAGGYSSLFIFAMASVALAGLVLIPIRSVR
ncbi:MFS transporter [Paenarthrobacter ureafaciens]|uniref:MFS transporter n=1 Tax=Paenarthrobacter ureafaciens TaxID=37931 RepID=UPI002DBB56BD|nr:MFS transporter [Paenarthrobacter ureafaciens]MEC3854109.1 MFS transporter [Paenarthrobacter ureafaciens]